MEGSSGVYERVSRLYGDKVSSGDRLCSRVTLLQYLPKCAKCPELASLPGLTYQRPGHYCSLIDSCHKPIQPHFVHSAPNSSTLSLLTATSRSNKSFFTLIVPPTFCRFQTPFLEVIPSAGVSQEHICSHFFNDDLK